LTSLRGTLAVST